MEPPYPAKRAALGDLFMTKPKDGALAVLPRVLLLALLLAAVPLIGCDRGTPPGDFVLAEPRSPSDKPAQTLEVATAFCQKKGIKSIAAIFSRLRPGKAEADFAACMRDRGYEVGR